MATKIADAIKKKEDFATHSLDNCTRFYKILSLGTVIKMAIIYKKRKRNRI